MWAEYLQQCFWRQKKRRYHGQCSVHCQPATMQFSHSDSLPFCVITKILLLPQQMKLYGRAVPLHSPHCNWKLFCVPSPWDIWLNELGCDCHCAVIPHKRQNQLSCWTRGEQVLRNIASDSRTRAGHLTLLLELNGGQRTSVTAISSCTALALFDENKWTHCFSTCQGLNDCCAHAD